MTECESAKAASFEAAQKEEDATTQVWSCLEGTAQVKLIGWLPEVDGVLYLLLYYYYIIK